MNCISVTRYRALMRAKLGLVREEEGDDKLIARAADPDGQGAGRLHADVSRAAGDRMRPGWLCSAPARAEAAAWLDRYRARMEGEGDRGRGHESRSIPNMFCATGWRKSPSARWRTRDDTGPLDRILRLVQSPYDEHPGEDALAQPPAPEYGGLSVSCSS